VDDCAGQRAAQRTERPFVAAWLIVVAGLGVALVVWGTQIGGVLDAPAPAASVATSSDPEGGAIFLPPATPAPRCLYVQNVGDNSVYISVETGSLLSEAQVQHCSK
jgi:hypothetical protein